MSAQASTVALAYLAAWIVALLTEILAEILPPDQNPKDAAAGIMAALHGNMLLGLVDSSESSAELRRASTAAILAWIQPK